ncbi:MAG: TetR/AcrR family transcriptional regulator [Propioniciclava sp.]
MTRAHRLPTAERRRTLIAATLPLLRTHGTAITTRQIAAAANVAEGTIFRVFRSKDELIHACLLDAWSPDHLHEQLNRAQRDTLAATIAQLLRALWSYVDEVRSLVTLIHPGGPPPPLASGSAKTACQRPDFSALHEELATRVTATLQPFASELSTTPAQAAALVIAAAHGVHHPWARETTLADPDHLARLLLTGLSQEV